MSTTTATVATTKPIVEPNKKRKASEEIESATGRKHTRHSEANESEVSDSRSATSDISLRDERGNKLIDWGTVQCDKCGKKAHYTSECLLNRLEARNRLALEARDRLAHRLAARGVHEDVHWIIQ